MLILFTAIHSFLSLNQINYHAHHTLLVLQFLPLSFSLFVFQTYMRNKKAGDYAAQWKKIDDLVNKGLTKSALAEVDKIYALSKKDQ